MKQIKAPEGMWYTQVGTPRRRMFIKILFIKDETTENKFELWTGEQKRAFVTNKYKK